MRSRSTILATLPYPRREREIDGTTRRLFALAGAALIFLSIPGSVRSESERAISGTVYDRVSGVPIEGATVLVDGTAWSALCDAAGCFVVRAVPPGVWSITIERYGFAQRCIDGVEVREGFERRLHIALDPLPVVLPGQKATGRASPLAVRRVELSPSQRVREGSIAEFLAEIPGVRVYGSAETPGGVRVSVGGEPAERVAVLLDGVPLSGGADGAVDLAAIPPAAIRVVELQTGGRSSSVGDAGIGGTVNLITESAAMGATPLTEARIGAGAFDSYRAGLSQRVPATTADGTFSCESFRRGSTFSYPSGDTNATRTGVKGNAAHLFTRWGDVPRGVKALGFLYLSNSGVPGPLEQATPGATNKDHHIRCQVQWQSNARRPVRGATALWYEVTHEHYRSPELYLADAEWREAYLGGQGNLGFNVPALAGRVSLETRQRRLEGIDHQRPAQSFGVQKRSEYAIRGDLSHGGRLFLGSGEVRATGALDVAHGEHGVFSPRLDLSWSVVGGLAVHGAWGRSFRRPGLTALFWKSDAYAAGNPELRPERASEWEIAAGWFCGRVVAETRYFERDVQDIIVWERDFTGRYKPQNLRAASVIGREDHFAIDLPSRPLVASLDYTHVFTSASDESGEPNTDGRTLVFTPRHTHQLRLSGQAGRVSVHLLGRWVSKRFTRRANTKSLPPYRVFDGSMELLGRRRGPRLAVSLSGENLTNEYVELLERYPSPGRSWSLALSIGL